jgi:hypothetical protein
MFVGNRRKAVPMVVRVFLPHQTNVSHRMPGRRRSQNPTVKVEPSSPANSTTKKRKVYSTIDGQPIGRMDSVDDELDSNPANGKRQKTTTGAVSRVRFDGVKVPEAAPSTRTTRKSTRSTAKASTKKDVGQLVQRLAKSFREVVETLEEIVDLDSN